MNTMKLLKVSVALIICLQISLHETALAQDEERCALISSSIKDAGFDDKVKVSCQSSLATIHSNTYPDHELMTGIVATNEQIPVPAASYAAPIALKPMLGTTPQSRDASLAIAVNGVPIYDYTAGGEMSISDLHHYQAKHDTIKTKQLDTCGGHAGRGDDYHYHTRPDCMIAQMNNAGDNAIIAWAFDGFPVYGHNNPDGSVIQANTLDVCNGQPDSVFGYRYHTSTDAPYIIQCLMGKVENLKRLPRVAPLKAANGGRGPDSGRPPRGGVDDLSFSQDDAGTRNMSYRYQGQDYYIRYSPSGQSNCYDYESRTITNHGSLITGEFCR